METRFVIYGGTNIPPDIQAIVAALVKELVSDPGVIIMSGGFDFYINRPRNISVDRMVADTAEKYIPEKDFTRRFETWLPKDDDRKKKVKRFEKGTVKRIEGSTQARRFNIVQHADAIITIRGEGHTRSIVELALAIDKPVLPIAFTGGDSKKMWEIYKDDIIDRLKPKPGFFEDIKEFKPLTANKEEIEEIAKKLAAFIKNAGEKKCLILMPFGSEHKAYFDEVLAPAVKEANFVPDRIDKSEVAGNIPLIFIHKLDQAKAVIVDITGFNPNVMYELGHVHSKKIVPLIISRSAATESISETEFPFYLKPEMITIATNNVDGYKEIKNAVARFLAKNKE